MTVQGVDDFVTFAIIQFTNNPFPCRSPMGIFHVLQARLLDQLYILPSGKRQLQKQNTLARREPRIERLIVRGAAKVVKQ